ncbi:MAG: SDR family oxidoreductase [Bryobacterales bacterium]|nr:SDR family oxidoreductase [Bryobacterales bacterium]
MSLHNKVAIITGGATGIGLGIARILGMKGVRLALVQPTPEHFAEAADSLAGAEAVAHIADISNREAVFQMVAQVEQRFGQIDILVNNAGLTGKPAVHSFLDCAPEQLDAIVDVNLKGTFHCSQAVARSMAAKGVRGSIIHISSVGAYAAQEFASVYCATKAAQVSLAQTMALELAPYDIRVNAIAPGDILTPANAGIAGDMRESGASGRYVRLTPLGRRGTPEDIGNAVAFLASDDAAFITGATLLVDGGWLAY